MKTIAITAALLLLAVTVGPALANPADNPESAFELDLRPAGGDAYDLHCDHNADLANCHDPSLWDDSNTLRGLQTKASQRAGKTYVPDSELLG
jgi:hypothetical protein